MRRPSIAIDLGTANTRIFSSDKGQVMEKPSTVAPSEVSENNSFSDDYITYQTVRFHTIRCAGV
jgi:actin-like ATPase involved in cell morphogenesis